MPEKKRSFILRTLRYTSRLRYYIYYTLLIFITRTRISRCCKTARMSHFCPGTHKAYSTLYFCTLVHGNFYIISTDILSRRSGARNIFKISFDNVNLVVRFRAIPFSCGARHKCRVRETLETSESL